MRFHTKWRSIRVCHRVHYICYFCQDTVLLHIQIQALYIVLVKPSWWLDFCSSDDIFYYKIPLAFANADIINTKIVKKYNFNTLLLIKYWKGLESENTHTHTHMTCCFYREHSHQTWTFILEASVFGGIFYWFIVEMMSQFHSLFFCEWVQ